MHLYRRHSSSLRSDTSSGTESELDDIRYQRPILHAGNSLDSQQSSANGEDWGSDVGSVHSIHDLTNDEPREDALPPSPIQRAPEPAHRALPGASNIDDVIDGRIVRAGRGTARCFAFTRWLTADEDAKYESTGQLIEPGEHERIKYIVWQLERGGRSARLHLQGFVMFEDKVRITGCKSRLFGLNDIVHIEACKGSPEQNRKYCTKDDTRIAGPWERGEMPASGQGKRNDIIKVVNHIKEKGFMSAAEAYPVEFFRHNRAFMAVDAFTMIKVQKRWITRLHLYVGAPGAGKPQLH